MSRAKRHLVHYYSRRWASLGRMLANPLSPGGELEQGWACTRCGNRWPLAANPGDNPCEEAEA